MAEEHTNETASTPEQPSSIHDLRPKMKLTGRVTRTDLYGAFVNIGVGRDALVHISKIQKGAVNRVEDVLAVGDEVTVYVDRVDRNSGIFCPAEAWANRAQNRGASVGSYPALAINVNPIRSASDS